mgnify:CR=1 FL=1
MLCVLVMEDVSVELEHAIGFGAAVMDGQHWHPNRRDYVYAAGACVGKWFGV